MPPQYLPHLSCIDTFAKSEETNLHNGAQDIGDMSCRDFQETVYVNLKLQLLQGSREDHF